MCYINTISGGVYTIGTVKSLSGSSFESNVLKISPLGYSEEVYLPLHWSVVTSIWPIEIFVSMTLRLICFAPSV